MKGIKKSKKQRAYLMSSQAAWNRFFQIGKSSLTPECTAAIAEAFNTRRKS